MTTENAYLCPQCGSPSMSIPLLAGGEYACEACGWAGDDPVLVPFGNPFGTADQTFKEFTSSLLNTFAKVAALPIGKLIVAWGFVPVDHQGKPSTQILARYIRAMAGGMITALIDERRKMELEKVEKHAGPRS